MRKLIVLLLIVAFLVVAIEANACAVQVVVPVVATVAGGTAGVVWVGLGVAAVAPFVLTSPYWWMFYANPECRKEPTLGDLSRCVQEKKK
jgi:hypothetical protein